MFQLQVRRHFDAAHFLTHYDGKCSQMHGHTWYVDVYIEGPVLGTCNMLIDFIDVKRLIDEQLTMLDHTTINVVLNQEDPTAEFLAKWLYTQLAERLHDDPPILRVAKVTVWESLECGVSYSEDEFKWIEEERRKCLDNP